MKRQMFLVFFLYDYDKVFIKSWSMKFETLNWFQNKK